MELIEQTGRKKIGERSRPVYCALFVCPYCGAVVERERNNGRRNKSCGCTRWALVGQAHKMHGASNSRLYRMWAGMKTRCLNKANPNYRRYGKRGIDVCDKWINNFKAFEEWALCHGYSSDITQDLTIDRINNDAGYSPDNCQIITRGQNAMKTSNTKLNWEDVETIRERYKNEDISMYQLASEYGVTRPLIGMIINFKSWKHKNKLNEQPI